MALENTIIIVADLGELKAYSIEKHEGVVENEMKVSHSLKLINNENFINGRKKSGELLSDKGGNFENQTFEEHNQQTEREKRTIKEIAEDIEMIVKETNPRELFLAFPKEHNNELTNILGQETKAVLAKNVASDLVKTKQDKLLEYFQ